MNPLAGRGAAGGGEGEKGRPRATTTEENAWIVEYAQVHVFCTTGEIKEPLGLYCDETAI